MKNTKRCSKCGIEKSQDAFNRHKANLDGLQSYCKLCQLEMIRVWREKNAAYMKQKDAEYREKHREERREYNRQWRQKSRDYWRSYQNERLKTDLNYRLHNYISAAIRKAIKKNHQ